VQDNLYLNTNKYMERLKTWKSTPKIYGEHSTKWVTISLDEYESMRSTIEILSDPKAVKEIREGEKARLEGKTKDIEQVRKELNL